MKFKDNKEKHTHEQFNSVYAKALVKNSKCPKCCGYNLQVLYKPYFIKDNPEVGKTKYFVCEDCDRLGSLKELEDSMEKINGR